MEAEFITSVLDAVNVGPSVGHQKKRSKKSSEGGGGGGCVDDVDSVAIRKRTPITSDQKHGASTRGVECGVCGQKDNSPDPIEPKYSRLWASYKLKKEGGSKDASVALQYVSDGPCCWLCVRLHAAKYALKFKLAAFKIEVGTNRALHEDLSKPMETLEPTDEGIQSRLAQEE
jgi:hypothetical protein